MFYDIVLNINVLQDTESCDHFASCERSQGFLKFKDIQFYVYICNSRIIPVEEKLFFRVVVEREVQC